MFKLHFLENEALNGQILLKIFYTFSHLESANCQSLIGLTLHTASEFSKSVFSKTNICSYIYTYILYIQFFFLCRITQTAVAPSILQHPYLSCYKVTVEQLSTSKLNSSNLRTMSRADWLMATFPYSNRNS